MTVFDSELYSIHVCARLRPFMCAVHACLYTEFLFMCTNIHVACRSSSHACTGVRTNVFIGLCAKRSSNLIAVQRVSTCDSRYIHNS